MLKRKKSIFTFVIVVAVVIVTFIVDARVIPVVVVNLKEILFITLR